jgi:murein DD-endopeptidase MepM/ murein hydrolase activator NlpD
VKAVWLTSLATLALCAPVAAAEKSPSGKVLTAKAPVSTLAKAGKPASKEEAAPSPEDETEHVVRDGETLGGIANRAHVARVLIIEANKLKAPYAVQTGQKLILPRTRQHVVKAGETGFDVAYQYGVPFGEIAVANGLTADSKLKPGQKLLIPTVLKVKPDAKPKAEDSAKLDSAPAKPVTSDDGDTPPRLVWPLDGKVRRGFTARSSSDQNGDYHDGLDIPAEIGTATRAAASGTVLFAGREPESFGNLVVVDHGNGWQSAYGFLSRLTVKKGDPVKARERVGLVGHTGKAGRDELHFELRHANQPVDPLPYLPKLKAAAKKDAPQKDGKKEEPQRKAQNTPPIAMKAAKR